MLFLSDVRRHRGQTCANGYSLDFILEWPPSPTLGRFHFPLKELCRETRQDFSPPVALPRELSKRRLRATLRSRLTETSDRVTLCAWGRVEGRLLLGTNAGANQRILLSNSGSTGRASPSLWLEATTDDEGNFVFDRVPGGGMEVAHLVLSKPNEQYHATCHSREVHIDVADGAVTQVTLGGSGGTVTGHAVVASSGTNVTDWRNATVSLTLKLVEAPEIPPREEYYASTGAFIEALMRFRGTHPDSLSEGSRAIELRRRRYVTLCDRNGAFRMPSVLGGTYELRIVLAEARATSVSPTGRQAKGAEVGSLVREVVVPEGIASQSEVSLDLGVLELASRP